MSLTPDQRQQARLIIRRYLEKAEQNQPDIHYSQARPLTSLGKPPDSEFWNDCQRTVHQRVQYWATCGRRSRSRTGGYSYSGWGFTGSILATNRRRRVPLDRKFFIGDMALYGPSLSNTRMSRCVAGMATHEFRLDVARPEPGPYATRLGTAATCWLSFVRSRWRDRDRPTVHP